MRKPRVLHLLLLLTVLLQGGCGLFKRSHHETTDYTPVFAAASGGDLATVKTAVEKDKRVLNAREWEGATLLHDAVQQNHADVAAFLINRGAEVNAATTDGLTPLHMAAQNGNVEMIKLLLGAKAEINATDAKGWTPLDRAMKWRHPNAADFLRAQGGRSSSHGVAEDIKAAAERSDERGGTSR